MEANCEGGRERGGGEGQREKVIQREGEKGAGRDKDRERETERLGESEGK